MSIKIVVFRQKSDCFIGAPDTINFTFREDSNGFSNSEPIFENSVGNGRKTSVEMAM